MSLSPAFDDAAGALPPQAARLGPKLRALAERGVYFGTCSWKYEGWLGSIYSPDRYQTRGKFSKKKFEAECLAEYAETFPTVCGDFAFYQFPRAEYWQAPLRRHAGVAAFGLKVPEDITVARWPSHARYGEKAGEENKSFLDTALLRSQFTRPLEPYAERVAVLIFEFGTFAKATFPSVDDFLDRLDDFLGALPARLPLRHRDPQPRVPGAGLFRLPGRAWRGPCVQRLDADAGAGGPARASRRRDGGLQRRAGPAEQGSHLREGGRGVRAVSRRSGSRTSRHAQALRQVAVRAMERQKPAFVFVNNRLEGNAPTTIEAVADAIGVGSLGPDG